MTILERKQRKYDQKNKSTSVLKRLSLNAKYVIDRGSSFFLPSSSSSRNSAPLSTTTGAITKATTTDATAEGTSTATTTATTTTTTTTTEVIKEVTDTDTNDENNYQISLSSPPFLGANSSLFSPAWDHNKYIKKGSNDDDDDDIGITTEDPYGYGRSIIRPDSAIHNNYGSEVLSTPSSTKSSSRMMSYSTDHRRNSTSTSSRRYGIMSPYCSRIASGSMLSSNSKDRSRRYSMSSSFVSSIIPTKASATKTSSTTSQYPIPISQWTYDNLHVEVDCLLQKNNRSKIPTSIIVLGNMLLQSDHMIETYSKDSDTNELDDNVQQLFNSSTSYSNRLFRSSYKKNHTAKKLMGVRLEKQMKRKYVWMNAMTYLQTLPDSSSTYIKSWDEAREIISYVFQYPSSSLSLLSPNYDDSNYNDNNQHNVTNDHETPRMGTSSLSYHNYKMMNKTPPFTSPSSSPFHIFDSNENHKTPSNDDFTTIEMKLKRMELDEYRNKVLGLTPSQKKFQEIITIMDSRNNEDNNNKQLEYLYHQHDERLKMEHNKVLKELELKFQKQQEELEAEKEKQESLQKLMRPLNDHEISSIQNEMSLRRNDNDIIVTYQSDLVRRSSFRTLLPGQWLNDEIIHYFLLMLSKRDEMKRNHNDEPPEYNHYFKSFFITKLRNEGHPTMNGVYQYNNVKRWSKNVHKGNIFNLNKIFFIINQGQMHWTCAVIYMKEYRIQFYDSMNGSGIHYLNDIFQYIQDEYKAKNNGKELPHINDWKLIDCTIDTPKQLNGFDCGVFTCMFCDFIAKDCPISLLTQDHINYCRQRIALSILQGNALE